MLGLVSRRVGIEIDRSSRGVIAFLNILIKEMYFFNVLFILFYLFIFGCVGSPLPHAGPL